jgi:hypothetical protein
MPCDFLSSTLWRGFVPNTRTHYTSAALSLTDTFDTTCTPCHRRIHSHGIFFYIQRIITLLAQRRFSTASGCLSVYSLRRMHSFWESCIDITRMGLAFRGRYSRWCGMGVIISAFVFVRLLRCRCAILTARPLLLQ